MMRFEHLVKTGRYQSSVEPDPDSLKPHRSIAVWPDTISVGNVVGRNESVDTHDSRRAAEAVCYMLERDGFGGDGDVFPVSTRVEKIDE